jgi:predicted O-methyltransferase YrrM
MAKSLLSRWFGKSVGAENARLRAQLAAWEHWSLPGHFYSPIPSEQDIAEGLAGAHSAPWPAIDFNEAGQVALMEKLAQFYPEHPFPEQATPGRRFYLKNPSYAAYDGLVLYGMLRHLKPRRIVEVGSGFSSAAMLDTRDQGFIGQPEMTFIDPEMSRLRGLLRADDHDRVTLLEKRVQEVPIELFRELGENDVLFIDSSHVSKIGSDVNRLLFEILPALGRGVYVHIHDVAANFEYPIEWLREGRAWNEQYLLRAFLMYNRAFPVMLLTGWFYNIHHDFICAKMPACVGTGGGQLWLRKDVTG